MADLDELALARNGSAAGPPAAIKPKSAEFNREIGIGFDMPFTDPYTPSHDIELIKEQGEDFGPNAQQLAVMRRTDGQARALFRLVTLPIRSALKTSTFIPAEGGDKEAQFIDDMFNLPPAAGGMSVPFNRFIAQVLLAVFDGFAPFEQVYWIPTHGPLKGKITLHKMAYRPAGTVSFLVDEQGGFRGFRQRTHFNQRVIDVSIPVETAYYFATQEEERPFYGISFFQAAFYHYDKKVRLYYVAHLAAQRAAVETKVGTAPKTAGVAERNSFNAALSKLGIAQYISLPSPDYKVDVLRGGGAFDFLSYINHHNSQMSKSVLASFFDQAQGGGAADTSLVNFGQQSDSLFLLMLQTLMDDIASSLNTYVIPKFVDWNFGPDGKYPKFRWGTFTDEQKTAIHDTFDKLATAGEAMNTTPEFFRELEKDMADEMGMEIDWDAVEEREAEEQAMQAAQFGVNGAPGGGVPTGAAGPTAGVDQGALAAGAPAVPGAGVTNGGKAGSTAPLPPEPLSLSAEAFLKAAGSSGAQ